MSRRKSDTADPVQEAPAEKEAAANVSDLAAKTEQRLCRSLWGRRTRCLRSAGWPISGSG